MEDDRRRRKLSVREYPGSTLFLACCGPAAVSVSIAYLNAQLFNAAHDIVVISTFLANLLIATTSCAVVGWLARDKPAEKPGAALAIAFLGLFAYLVATLCFVSLAIVALPRRLA